MKKTLLLTRIFAISFLILGMHTIQSQIVYTDINPDTIVDASKGVGHYNYFLDLNNDGTKDFEIRHFRPDSTFMAVEIYCKDTNTQILIFSGNEVFQLTTENIVLKSPPFNGTWVCSVFNSSNSAQIVYSGGSNDFYVGLRIKISGKWHYGWARLNTPKNFSKITIRDYAYNTVADQQILTGQKTITGIGTYAKENNILKIYPNPFNLKTGIGLELTENSTVQIVLCNALGQQISELENRSLQAGKYMYDLNVSGKGIYFLRSVINGVPSTQRLIQVE
ncbi:MAG: T9SS type A sorting domain-containing protein [Bacteroidetes bacterium]|nr:T9SS type A sorting domain-containing protein [Bacteroidota bacterium]